MNPNVSYGLWVTLTCQCRFTDCNKCTTLLGAGRIGEAVYRRGGEVYGKSPPSAQYCWEPPKTDLRSKVSLKKKKKRAAGDPFRVTAGAGVCVFWADLGHPGTEGPGQNGQRSPGVLPSLDPLLLGWEVRRGSGGGPKDTIHGDGLLPAPWFSARDSFALQGRVAESGDTGGNHVRKQGVLLASGV